MRFASIPLEIMRMLVVVVMCVQMLMIEYFMDVFMLVVLADVQPNAQSHQSTCNPEAEPRQFAQQDQ